MKLRPNVQPLQHHQRPPCAKAISAWFDDRRGLALGIAVAGVGLGAIIMPQIATRSTKR
jgi:hypothetical protein